MRCSLQQLVADHFDDFASSRRLHPRELHAAWCIRHCHTAVLGQHRLVCPAGHVQPVQYHACRHRSCPRCAATPRREWIEARLQQLLPCPHFHVVFTLPHELLDLWAFNRRAMIELLMRSVRECLLQLLASPRHGSIVPGLLLALHTWGRDLSYHPHVHCLVSAGGVDAMGAWKPLRRRFLLPLKPLRALFRGKFLAGMSLLLRSGLLTLPPSMNSASCAALVKRLYTKHWNIQIQPPYDSADGVAKYLARYVKGGPIPADRPLSIDASGFVRMPYTDHRDHRTKTLRLHVHDFLARVLWHAPPAGQHCVRHAGLYNSALRSHHASVRLQLLSSLHAAPTLATPAAPPAPRCTTCGRVLLPAPPVTAAALRQHANSIRHTASARLRAVHLGPTQRSNGHPAGQASRAPPTAGILVSARLAWPAGRRST